MVVQYIEPTTENGFTSYETTLERQLYRAMSQLERLQRMRQGEAVPAPMVMEVSEKAITYKGIFAKRTQIEKVPSGS